MAVLGSFWAIVWFIRAYVEAPRVNIPAPMVLAAGESRPAPAPESRVIPQAEAAPAALVVQVQAKSTTPPVAAAAAKNSPAASRKAEPSAAGAVADRWFPMNQLGAPARRPGSANADYPGRAASAARRGGTGWHEYGR